MTINNLEVAAVKGGGLSGLLALHCTFADGGEKDAIAALYDIRAATSISALRGKTLCIHQEDSADVVLELTDVLPVLKAEGWRIVCFIDGMRRPAWIEWSDYTIAVIKGRWLQMPVNEIWYRPEESLIEPKCGEANVRASKYVVVERKLSAQELFNFIADAGSVWNLVVPPVRDYKLRVE